VLFAIFPEAFKTFAIRVMQDTETIAVIAFEFAIVGLSIWPHVDSFAVLFASLPVSEVKSPIRPLVKPLATH
jgi:hypothetical protein